MVSEFANKIIEELEKRKLSFNIVGQISGLNYGTLSITSLCGSPITLDCPVKLMKVRFQTLTSGANFTEGVYRVDNCHGEPIHQHFKPSEQKDQLIGCKLLKDFLPVILGSEFEEINKY